MALPTFHNAGVASVTTGGTVVTGDTTYWQSVLEPGDLFTDGSGLLVRIASVDSETQLTLAYGWPGDDIVSGPYEVQLVPRSVGVQERTRQLLEKVSNGTEFKYDESGPLSDRGYYDLRRKNFGFLDTSKNPPELYVKASDTAGDWAGPFIYGSGPVGPAPGLTFDPVLTGDAGSDASATVTGAGPYSIEFTIPRGDQGFKGWTVEPELVIDGSRRVLRIAGFIGGEGDEPSGVGLYIGAGGLVEDISNAIDIRGVIGPQGVRGLTWRRQWNSGSDYTPDDLVSDNDASEIPATWIATVANTGSRPRDNPSAWDRFPVSASESLDDGVWGGLEPDRVLVHGTTTERLSVTPSLGQIGSDDSIGTIVLGDGTTVGGIPMAREDSKNVGSLGYAFDVKTGSSYAVTQSDSGKGLIANRSDAIAFTLSEASVLGPTFIGIIHNVGSGLLTVSTSGSDTVDGVSSLTFPTGTSAVIQCDGTQFRTVLSTKSVPTVLSADRNYYVRLDGNDANTGLTNTAAGAFRTVQRAVDVAARLDWNGYVVRIYLQAGTSGSPSVYSGSVKVSGMARGQQAALLITTTDSTFTNTTVSATADAITVTAGAWVQLSGFAISSTSGSAILVSHGGRCYYGNVAFGVTGYMHINVDGTGSKALCISNILISGNAQGHIHITNGAFASMNSVTVYFSGTITFSAYFAGLAGCSVLQAYSFAWSGSAIGYRFTVHKNSVIDTSGQNSATYFPGNAAGVQATGGIWV